ncbi:hypothetical protein QBC37DRAFT_435302 [Rhypophila decipiens]|uniref:Uncharacterized protein n=1 Tax=Rhypophila decipiens TaxID=261697 RepID=A0AAN6XSL9_9PEZI|nr:hypothetical protein QBC37DRAFT_435302 [Rhypophila decipiens]
MARLRFLSVIFLQAATLHFSPSLATKSNFIGTQSPINIQTDTMAKQLSDLPFKRIRVANQQDIDRLYPVLAAYVQNPDLASTVTELVIDAASWPDRYRRLTFHQEDQQALIPAPGPDEVAAHKQIEAHARALGLGSEATTWMLESLSWKFSGQPSPSTDPWRHSPPTYKGFANVASTLLLSLCPNITLLHAYGLEYAPPPLADFLLRNNYGLLPAKHLQHLDRVHMQAWNPNDNREYDRLEFLNYFRFFGRLPALRTYSADAVVEYQANREVAVPGSSPSITKITITNSEVSADMLGTIIRVPRALEELTLTLGGLSFFEGGMAVVNPKTLGKCLLEHKRTLKKLELDVACMLSGSNRVEAEEEPYEEEDGYVYGKDEYFRLDEQAGNGQPLRPFDLPNTRRYGLTIGSLHDFEALEHLAISVRLMLGPVVRENVMSQRRQGETVIPPFRLVDALPRTLKSLQLYDYVVGECPLADEHVKELKEKMADAFPFLTEVSGLDEPLIKNSKYDENSGYDTKNPSELAVLRRVHNRGLDWEFA